MVLGWVLFGFEDEREGLMFKANVTNILTLNKHLLLIFRFQTSLLGRAFGSGSLLSPLDNFALTSCVVVS